MRACAPVIFILAHAPPAGGLDGAGLDPADGCACRRWARLRTRRSNSHGVQSRRRHWSGSSASSKPKPPASR